MSMKYNYRNHFIILLGILALFSAGCQDSESSAKQSMDQNQDKALPVSIMVVQPAPIQDVISLPGETEGWHDVRVAADTGGRIEWMGPQEGDTVAEGDLMAKIDVSVLKASRDRAEAAYRLADDLYQRRQRLFKQGIVTQEELERSKTERTLAYMDLKQIRVRYDQGFLRAPIPGVINRRYVDAGEFIDTGKPVADIVNIDRIKINVHVPELDVRYLSKGQKAPLKIDAYPEKQFVGTISFIAYKADPATKTFLTRTVIENPDHAIRPGMIARVAFMRRMIPDAVTAPLFAIVDKSGERLVYIEKDGIAHSRTITIGVIEKDRIQVTDGLDVGDHLIVKGQKEVEEGMKVMVQ